jgi:hypothetical protein
VDGTIKILNDKKTLKQNILYHHYRRFYKEFCTQKMKANKTMEDRKYQTTGEEKTSNQRVALIWLHTI